MSETAPGSPKEYGQSAALVANELKKAKERIQQLERGLYEVFPVEAYRMARPDVAELCNNNTSKIVEHFLEYGINEMDIEQEELSTSLGYISR